MGVIFGNREFIDDVTLPGAQVQHFSLEGTRYGALFIPRQAWDDSTAQKVNRELGIHLPVDAYEIKFDTLDSLLDDTPAHGFRSRHQLGLRPFTFKELNLLGAGLLESIILFDQDFRGSGYYGCAVDDNPQLCHYYKRLYRRYGNYFIECGLMPHTSTRGTCYAFLRD
ncbi:hypothetical protein [Vreelandella massiliensis]|uniref:hypothetical protein n=1 Tax=Vreelandella massiliensis TaxID=1816686 RepID=UPI00096A9406|nr:hypothetical protein [Halomonas massiliensis]